MYEMYHNELAFKDHERGMKVAKALLDENYAVLLTYEESLLIVNWEWCEKYADREQVVFMPRYQFDEMIERGITLDEMGD